MAVPAVIEALVEAARRHDLAAMHALIDWEPPTLAVLARALGEIEPAQRAEASRRGLADASVTSRDPRHVENILGELMLDLNDPGLAVRPASDEEAALAGASVRIGPVPGETAPEVARKLEEARAAAKDLREVWVLGRRPPGREYPVLIASQGERLVLAPAGRPAASLTSQTAPNAQGRLDLLL